MTETLATVTKKKPEPTAEPVAAEELVRRAREQGLSLTGPDGLLKQLTKVVIETALDQEMTEHLGHERNVPAGNESGNVRNGSRPKKVLTEGSGQVAIDQIFKRGTGRGGKRLAGMAKVVEPETRHVDLAPGPGERLTYRVTAHRPAVAADEHGRPDRTPIHDTAQAVGRRTQEEGEAPMTTLTATDAEYLRMSIDLSRHALDESGQDTLWRDSRTQRRSNQRRHE